MIDELIERVEKGEGAERQLDGEIFIALSPECQAAGRVDHLQGVVGWWPKDGPYESARNVPRYTASLDAVLALIDEKLPGSECEVTKLAPFSAGRIWKSGWRDHSSVAANAPSPARALLAAFLKAHKEQHDG